MPTIFIAGTADTNGYYPGSSITSPSNLLTQIKDALVAAGQTVTDDIANNKIIARGVDQGDFCYKIYTTVLVSGLEYKLTLQGDNSVGGAGTLLSSTIDIPFYNNGNAKLYLAADAGGECISILNPNLPSKGFHGGWLERRRSQDKGAWMIGYLDVWMTNAFFAKDFSNTDWVEVKRYFYGNTGAESTTAPAGMYQFLWDSCTSYAGGTSTAVNTSSDDYKPYLGAVDPISFSNKLLPYGYGQGYLGGTTSPTGYPTTIDATLGRGIHLPGFVRFAKTGLCYLSAGEQVKDGTKTFVSAGDKGSTGFTGFQGFQIAA
jgi:hypothetical protein